MKIMDLHSQVTRPWAGAIRDETSPDLNLKSCMWGFCHLLIFSKSTFSKNSFRNTIIVSNSLDPDQARHFVGPDLDPYCLQRLSAEDTSRKKKINL